MATFHFELTSPEQLVFSGEVEHVVVPGSEGEFGVLANHAPLIAMLRPGILTILGANEKRFVVRGGFAEVNPKGLTVLAFYNSVARSLPDYASYSTVLSWIRTTSKPAEEESA